MKTGFTWQACGAPLQGNQQPCCCVKGLCSFGSTLGADAEFALSADPFSLSRDGDKLRGRGTTDCLGHVALMACLFKALAQKRPPLKRTVVGVWIANEENSKVGGVTAACGLQLVTGMAHQNE